MIFNSLKNIETSFQHIKKVSVLSICLSSVISMVSVTGALVFAEKQREKIYVLDQGKSLIMALSQNLDQNRPAEAREHVRRFHELFFNLTPDRSQIEENIERALQLADKSAYNQYVDIAEKGYYNRLISAGITQTIKIDSLNMDFDSYPYKAHTYATEKIIRESTITKRSLITECNLYNTSRSENNPGGFQITKFRIIENGDIETIDR